MATNSSSRELIGKLEKGEIKLYQLDELLPAEAAEIRARFLEKSTGAKLQFIRSSSLTPEDAKGNIENMIGAVQVPLGIAGPLEIKGKNFRGKAFVPLATTEGALVASVNRGCSAISRSGGAKAEVIKAMQTRAPLFKAQDEESAAQLIKFVRNNFSLLKKTAEKTSSHLKLKEIECHCYDDLVWLRIKAETGNAMGMNMISIAAQAIGELIEKKVQGIKYLAVSGNLCTDKKPSYLTLKEGRGRYAIAEATIKGDIVRKVLKTTPQEMAKLNIYKNIIGSTLAGSYGMNAHFANVIAAIYLATGQDMAHVVEGSHGTTEMKVRGNDLNVKVTIPSIQAGTIGGGTKLPGQQESIRLMGINPASRNSANQLAEVIASAVLAGEISIMAALASGQLVDSHKRLNR